MGSKKNKRYRKNPTYKGNQHGKSKVAVKNKSNIDTTNTTTDLDITATTTINEESATTATEEDECTSAKKLKLCEGAVPVYAEIDDFLC